MPELVPYAVDGPQVAAYNLEMPDDGTPPSEFRIFRAGLNKSSKGDFVFDDESAKSVLAVYAQRGIQDVVIDYEHQSLEDPPIKAPAAGWFIPEVRNGELWATSVRWTPSAVGHLAAKEYRLFSPAMDVERKSGRVTRLRNVALTNNPAMFAITPLVAASDKEPKMPKKLVCKACGDDIEPDGDEGYKNMVAYHKDHAPKMKATKKMTDTLALSEDTSIEEVERKLVKLADFKAEVLKLAGKEKGSEALGVLMALKASHDEVVKLRAQIADQDKATKLREFDALVEKGKAERKLSPALVESWVPKLREAGEAGAVQLKAFLDVAPALTSGGSVEPPKVDQVSLTDDEKKIAKLMGNDEKEVVAYKQKQAAGAAR